MTTITHEGAVAIIRLDDGKVNAMSREHLETINGLLDEAEKDSGAIVLAGREGVFSAGFDLKAMQGGDIEARHAMTAIGSATVSRLFSSPIPVVAAVTGHALALGAVLASACDYAVGQSGKFSIGVNETKIGEPFPPWGYEVLLTKLSKKHIHTAAVLSTVYDVETAVEANFLNEMADDAIARAIELATEYSTLPREAYMANKKVIRGAALQRVADSVGPF